MKNWFFQIKHHEQIMLIACGFLLSIFLAIKLIWQPIFQEQEAFARKNQLAAESLVKIREMALQYEHLNGKAHHAVARNVEVENLPKLIDQSVAQSNLKMSRFQPSESGDVMIRFDSAKFSNVIGWLNLVELEYGLSVKELAVNSGIQSGLVNVTARIGLES